MNTQGFFKIDLKQSPNKREKIIFWATLAILMFGFFKACVITSEEALGSVKQKIESLEIEKKQLLTKKPNQNNILGSKIFVGNKNSLKNIEKKQFGSIHKLGIAIQESGFSKIEDHGGIQKKGAYLVAQGSLSSLMAYLEYLENLKTPFIVEEIALNPMSDSIQTLRLELNGGYYFQ